MKRLMSRILTLCAEDAGAKSWSQKGGECL